MIPSILKLDSGGLPVGWIRWQTAATLYARKRVSWEAGAERFRIFGGLNAGSGERSHIEIGSIIAVTDRTRKFIAGSPLLTNRTLFQRDHNLCLYCGQQFSPSVLTRDHILTRPYNTLYVVKLLIKKEISFCNDFRAFLAGNFANLVGIFSQKDGAW
jgi:hypothetical protein